MTTICTEQYQVNAVKTRPMGSAILARSAAQISLLASYIKRQFALAKQRRIDRDAMRQLAHLDDHILADIGIKREDVLWASNLPVSVNASDELAKIARLNRNGAC